MSESITDLLQSRHEAKLAWLEPWKAVGPEGNEISAYVEMRATVHDCINLMRASWDAHGIPHLGRDEDLLLDFMTVHWAAVVR